MNIRDGIICFSILMVGLGNAEPLELVNTKGVQITAEVLSLSEGKVKLRRADGRDFTIPISALSEASQKQVQTVWKERAASVSGEVAKINKVLGHELFSKNGKLWDEPIVKVAQRLKLPEESSTPYTSSYRRYTRPGYRFAGAEPKTVVAYGNEKGKAESFSLIFANKGDTLSNVGSGEDHFKSNGKEIDRGTLEGAMLYDEESISQTLSKIFGKPVKDRILGQGNRTDAVQRWDWEGHAFLLANVEDEYVSLRITPTEFADNGGKSVRIADDVMRERLLKNVKREPNGDVYIDQIPMVDQGPKGYCAPATFERAMRHAGVAADMYLLATLATSPGGGTYTGKLYDEVAFTTRSKGGRTARAIEMDSLAPKKIQKYIDKGVPILWQMRSLNYYNKVVNARMKVRAGVSDWKGYAQKIAAEAKKNAPHLETQASYHICMIIGYNEATNEIAVSDSWGKRYTIRWVHVDEAEAVSNNSGYVIDI